MFPFVDMITCVESQLHGSIWVPYIIKSCRRKEKKKYDKTMKAGALTHCADSIPRRLLRSLRQMPHNFPLVAHSTVVAQFSI